MPLNDASLRTLPGDLIFPDAQQQAQTFSAIHDEIEARGEGAHDPGAFALLAATRRALTELRESDGSPDGGHSHAILLFHVWHSWLQKTKPCLVSVPAARWAVETSAGTEGDDGVGLPTSCYIQLPQHLFWVRETEEDRPRPLDGFYWTRIEEQLHLLGVVDPGASSGGVEVLPLPAVPLADRSVWLTETMREEGEDFRSSIPGSELEGLYELRTAGELLKLAASLDRFVERFADAATDHTTEAGQDFQRLVLRPQGATDQAQRP